MKIFITHAIFSCLFLQTALSLSCQAGYVEISNKCWQCLQGYQSCTTGAAKFVSKISGAKQVNGVHLPYCPTSPSSYFYNKNTGNCQTKCKQGCKSCKIDYDFCLDCYSGWIWSDYSCIPAVIGLSATTLALLAVALIASIITFWKVLNAKKN